jgi:hypothetical protein
MTTKLNLELQKQELKSRLSTLSNEMVEVRILISNIDNDINYNVFDTVELAEDYLFNRFECEANDACEGSHCCGEDKYTQDFMVDGVVHTAVGDFEYNRHDKTYYYIDESDFYSVVKEV